jgi:hypothetical protein
MFSMIGLTRQFGYKRGTFSTLTSARVASKSFFGCGGLVPLHNLNQAICAEIFNKEEDKCLEN